MKQTIWFLVFSFAGGAGNKEKFSAKKGAYKVCTDAIVSRHYLREVKDSHQRK